MTGGVLFLSYDLFSLGGIQRFSRYTLRALGGRLPEGSLTACSLHPPVPDGFGTDIRVEEVGQDASLRSRRAFARSVLALADEQRPRLVVCDHVRLAPLGRAVARRTGGAYCVNVYGLEVWGPLTPRRRQALREADVVVSDCVFTKRLLEESHPPLRGKIAVVEDAVDCDRFVPGDVPAERFGLGAAPLILTVSRLAPGRPKGHERVFEAMAALRRSGQPVTYLVAGDGADRPRLEALARRLGLDDSVVFLGPVPEQDLALLYRLCDVFILASGFKLGLRPQGEGVPLVALEAQASGRPVITSKLDGSAESIVDGETGLLVDPHDSAEIADALHALLRDPERRRRMGIAARRLAVGRFSFETFEEKLFGALAPWLPAASSPALPVTTAARSAAW